MVQRRRQTSCQVVGCPQRDRSPADRGAEVSHVGSDDAIGSCMKLQALALMWVHVRSAAQGKCTYAATWVLSFFGAALCLGCRAGGAERTANAACLSCVLALSIGLQFRPSIAGQSSARMKAAPCLCCGSHHCPPCPITRQTQLTVLPPACAGHACCTCLHSKPLTPLILLLCDGGPVACLLLCCRQEHC